MNSVVGDCVTVGPGVGSDVVGTRVGVEVVGDCVTIVGKRDEVGAAVGDEVGAAVGDKSTTVKLPAVPLQVLSAPPLSPPTLQDTSES